MRKRLKGFTLIELIIVMAIFGVIMAAAIGLMSPVSKMFKSTASYEQTRSAVDNIQRYLSGTLRYADRFSMYIEYEKDGATVNEISETNIQDNVIDFAGSYFYAGVYGQNGMIVNEKDTPVYVLVFDNENYKISKYTFTPSSGTWVNALNYDGSSNDYSASGVSSITTTFEEYAINEELFSDYGFKVYLGSYDYLNDGSDNYAFSPQDYDSFPTFANLAFTIDAFKKYSDGSYECLMQATSMSFSLTNIVDVNSVNDINAGAACKTDSLTYYDSTVGEIKSASLGARGNIYPEDVTERTYVNRAGDSFYIIYTLPERVEDYVANNQNDYNYSIATTTEVSTS